MSGPLERLVDDCDAIGAWWPDLHADLVPGTRRRVVESRREDADGAPIRSFSAWCPDCGSPIAWLVSSRQPYCTRPWSWKFPACSTGVSLGFSPSSTRVDVLDDLELIRTRVLGLEADVRGVLGDVLPARVHSDGLGAPVLSSSVDTHVEPRGHHVAWTGVGRTIVDGQPAEIIDDQAPVDWLRTRTRTAVVEGHYRVGGYPIDISVLAALAYLRTASERLDDTGVRAAAAVLGSVVGICRHAAGASRRAARVPRPCPVCDRLSLVVLEAVYDPDTGELRDLRPDDRRVALCTADDCECVDAECVCRSGRRHRWPEDDWARLGLVLADHDEAVRTSA